MVSWGSTSGIVHFNPTACCVTGTPLKNLKEKFKWKKLAVLKKKI